MASLGFPLSHLLAHKVLFSALHLSPILDNGSLVTPIDEHALWYFDLCKLPQILLACFTPPIIPRPASSGDSSIVAIHAFPGTQDIHKVFVSFRQIDASLVRIDEWVHDVWRGLLSFTFCRIVYRNQCFGQFQSGNPFIINQIVPA